MFSRVLRYLEDLRPSRTLATFGILQQAFRLRNHVEPSKTWSNYYIERTHISIINLCTTIFKYTECLTYLPTAF